MEPRRESVRRGRSYPTRNALLNFGRRPPRRHCECRRDVFVSLQFISINSFDACQTATRFSAMTSGAISPTLLSRIRLEIKLV